MAASPSASKPVRRLTLPDVEEADYHTYWFYLILLSSKITGLSPSVQQDTEVPSSFIQGWFPPCISVVTTLYKSFQAQWQKPSGIPPFSPTTNSWPSLNTLQASIDCPIGGLSPKICLVSVLFKTVIFSLPFSTIISPNLCPLADLLILTLVSSSSNLVLRITPQAVEKRVAYCVPYPQDLRKPRRFCRDRNSNI